MPEFILDHGSAETAKQFRALDSFTQGYIEALFFTDEEQLCEDSGREMAAAAINLETMESRFVGGDSSGFGDLAADTLAMIVSDCHKFQVAAADILFPVYESGIDYAPDQAGRDFWYTRNGHGVGFWDRGLGKVGDRLAALCGHGTAFPGVDSYVGDDGLIYLA